MLVEDINYTESKEYLASINTSEAFNKMWSREAIKGTSCPKLLTRLFIRRFYFKLLDLDTPLINIPTCSKFQRTDWSKYEIEYGFTIESKLVE